MKLISSSLLHFSAASTLEFTLEHMQRYSGIILDIDGTLIDSNDAHARAWVSALKDGGFRHSFEEVRPMVGMGGDQILRRLEGISKADPRYKTLSEGWKRHFETEELHKLEGQPGARELVLELAKRGFKLVVGTSSDESLVQRLLEVAGVADLLEQRTTASDVEASKPEPDIVKAALSKLRLEAADVLMVGDTPFDVQAAEKAGVGTVFLRCGGDSRNEGAVAVYDSPQDLLEHLDTSPLRTLLEGEKVG